MTVSESNRQSRILNGALRALSRHGIKRLSMSDVSEEAGVSRGTVYRYFANREQLLDALAHHVQRGFEIGLEQAIAAQPDLDRRIDVVLTFLAQVSDRPEIVRLEELQPLFVLGYFRREFHRYMQTVDEALRPAFERSELVRSGRVDPAFLSELVQRVMMSARLLGAPDVALLAKQLTSLLEAVVTPAR